MPGTSFPGVISGISGIRTALSCAQPLLKDEPQSGLDCPGISMPRRISVKTGQQQVPLSTAGRASGQGTGNGPKTRKDPACQANPAAPEPATLRFSPSSRTSGWTGSPGRQQPIFLHLLPLILFRGRSKRSGIRSRGFVRADFGRSGKSWPNDPGGITCENP